MTVWWLKTHFMTLDASFKDGKVVSVSPVAARFVGQPVAVFMRWLLKQGGFEAKRIEV